jgi:hypothetical protein
MRMYEAHGIEPPKRPIDLGTLWFWAETFTTIITNLIQRLTRIVNQAEDEKNSPWTVAPYSPALFTADGAATWSVSPENFHCRYKIIGSHCFFQGAITFATITGSTLRLLMSHPQGVVGVSGVMACNYYNGGGVPVAANCYCAVDVNDIVFMRDISGGTLWAPGASNTHLYFGGVYECQAVV